MTTLYNADAGNPLYLDFTGQALKGSIYFGVPNLNPVTNPVTVYWDAAGTQPAAQPIAVSGGRTVRSDGTPARVWISGDYSKLVLDSKGGQVDFQASQQTPAIPVTVTVDKFSGTGAPATYTLSVTPQGINDTSVFVGGVYQQKSSYTLVGNQLTITAAVGTNNVEVNTAQNLDWSSIASTLTTAAATAQTNATAAAASRAQMLYIVQGSFAPGTPPTHRDDGSAIQNGDYAFFTDNLFRRYNGATWVASDINTANLAASSGSSLVGFLQAGTGAVARTEQDKLRDVVSLKDFGVKADGSNEGGLLQAALNAAAGKVLRWNTGSYLTNQLTVPANTTIEFDEGVTISLATGVSNFTIFNVYLVTNVCMRGGFPTLKMTKADYAGASNHGVIVNSSSRVRLESLYVKDCGGDGIYIGGASTDTACSGITVLGCTIDNCRRNGVSVTFATGVVLDGCEFKNMAGSAPQAGIDLEPNVGTSVSYVQVSNCYAHNNTGGGFLLSYGAQQCTLSGCVAAANGDVGFRVASDNTAVDPRIPTDNSLIGCTAYGNTSSGLYVFYANRLSVSGFVSRANGGFGAQFQGSNNCAVVGSIFDSNTSRGVAVPGVSGLIFSGNQVINNAGGGLIMTGLNTDCVITGNQISGNYDLSNTFDCNVALLASNSTFAGNTIRKGSGTNKPATGINFNSGSVSVLFAGNDTVGGGTTTDVTAVSAAMVQTFIGRGWIRSGNGGSAVGGFEVPFLSTQAASRTWRFKNDDAAFGDLAILQETTQGGGTFAAKLRFDLSGNPYPGSDNTQTFGLLGTSWSTGYFYNVRAKPVTVASLPGAGAIGAGTRASVSDSTVAGSGNFGAVVAGGGTSNVPVYSDGTNWRIG